MKRHWPDFLQNPLENPYKYKRLEIRSGESRTGNLPTLMNRDSVKNNYNYRL